MVQIQLQAQEQGKVQPDEGAVGTTRATDLFLMHHYSTTTCESLSDGVPEHLALWKTWIPKEGLKYEFLMEGILAVSALHLASLEPASTWAHTEHAMRLQNSALSAFQHALRHADDENCHAVFIFSVILTILGLASCEALLDPQLSTPSKSLISLVKLLKGVKAIAERYRASLKTSPVGCMFQQQGRCGKNKNIPMLPDEEIKTALDRLRERCHFLTKYAGRGKQKVYLDGIDALQGAFKQVAESRRFAIIVAWPVMVSVELAAFFEQGDPMAQLVWIHYGVLCLSIHGQWWGRNFGVRLIAQLSDSLHGLDPEWADWTAWPRYCASMVDVPSVWH